MKDAGQTDHPADPAEASDDWPDRFMEQAASSTNRDGAWLGPLGPCGHVDRVNGYGATEVPEFVPTRDELLQLVKYWETVALHVEFDRFCLPVYGDANQDREHTFAGRRLDRLAGVLGEDSVRAAVDEAHTTFGRQQEPEAWRIFKTGTDAERKAFEESVAALEFVDVADEGKTPSGDGTMADKPALKDDEEGAEDVV